MSRFLFIIISSLLLPNMVFSQELLSDLNWQLKWQDNFDSFDHTKWQKKKHDTEQSLQPNLYVENCVWTSNSNLVIEVNNNGVYINIQHMA